MQSKSFSPEVSVRSQLASAVKVFCVLCVAFLTSERAFADNFSVYRVASSSGSTNIYGLTDAGTLTVFRLNYGPGPNNYVYTTFTPPGGFVQYNNVPPFTFDNGSSCNVSVSGLKNPSIARCNGQYSLFSAFTATGSVPSLYLLTGSTLQMLYEGATTTLFLNAFGDVAFDGLANGTDVDYLYYNETSHAAAAVTPEPSSLLMLVSGAASSGLLLWRRRRTNLA